MTESGIPDHDRTLDQPTNGPAKSIDDGDRQASKSDRPSSEDLPTQGFVVSEDASSSDSGRPATRQIGPYKLLQQIGEGGMGTVWMAEQRQPVSRRVALKLIKAGVADQQILARFEAERQAVAMMNHDNIAKILDAGTTDDGAPFFVMELVQGVPIAEYCNRNQLTPQQRLELFAPVCLAVQHAHQKGVIHRDLKPGNILVGIYDGKPIAKVIDFGLAKALEHHTKLTDKTMFTEFGQVLGTLQYMSPEQAQLDGMDIDTRTDIYSLGVILYELLTGSTPIDKETLQHNALLQVLEIIRKKEPPRPSQRLSSSRDLLSTAAERQQIQPVRLQRMLRGDLDWIVMKALEKNRTRRYDSAKDFYDDIERYVNNEAIEARPPSTTYRLQKFISNHRGLVASLATITALLVGAVAVSSVFAIRAGQAEKKAMTAAETATAEARKSADLTLVAEKERDRSADLTLMAEKERDKTAEALAQIQVLQKESERQLAISNYQLASARWDENRSAEAQELLERIPAEHRNFEWYYSLRRFQGSQFSIYGHTGGVGSVSFSPDGKWIVSGARDKTIKIFNAITGEKIRTLKGHTKPITCVSFSPDGRRIASAGEDHTIRIWDAKNGKKIHTLKGHANDVYAVSFSPDNGRIVSCSSDRTSKIWDVEKGSLVNTLKPPVVEGVNRQLFRVYSVSFSPDGKQIISGGQSRFITIWDAQTGEEIRNCKGHTRFNPMNVFVASVCFSPDGKRFASGCSDETVSIWDVESGKETHVLKGHTGYVHEVSFSSDGRRIVSCSGDKSIKVWDADSGAELHTLSGHTDEVLDVKFSPDGHRIVSGSRDKSIKVWGVDGGSEVNTLRGHGYATTSVCFSPDGQRIAVSSRDYTVSIWDAKSNSEILRVTGHRGDVNCVSFSPDGRRIVTSGNDGRANIWDVKSGERLQTFESTGGIFRTIFSPDGRRVAACCNDHIKIWDAQSGAEIRTLKGDADGLCFSPDGRRIASGGEDKVVTIWDAESGKKIRTLTGHVNNINSVDFSPDGRRIVSGSRDQTIKIWDAQSGEEIDTLKGHLESVTDVKFSPDGRRIASSSLDHSIKIWNANADTKNAAEIQTLRGHTDAATCVNFSPDGGSIVSSSNDTTIKIWNAASDVETRKLKGHASIVTGVSFSPDSQRIFSVSQDGEKRVWSCKTGELIADEDWNPVDPSVKSKSVKSPDDRWLVLTDKNDILLVDRQFKFTDQEKARRESFAKLDVRWFIGQFAEASESENSFAETVNLSWVLKAIEETKVSQHRKTEAITGLIRSFTNLKNKDASVAETLKQNQPVVAAMLDLPLTDTVGFSENAAGMKKLEELGDTLPPDVRKILKQATAKIKVDDLKLLLRSGQVSNWSVNDSEMIVGAPDFASGFSVVAVTGKKKKTKKLLRKSGKDPAWQRVKDGLVAFVDEETIWLFDRRTDSVTKIGPGSFPSWNHDGTRLFYRSADRESMLTVKLTDNKPDSPKKLCPLSDAHHHPRVSPNGKLIATQDREKNRFRILRVESGEEVASVSWRLSDCVPTWSPDNKQVLFGSDGSDKAGLWLFDIASGQIQKVLDGNFTAAAWSSDGKMISVDNRNEKSIYTFPASGLD